MLDSQRERTDDSKDECTEQPCARGNSEYQGGD